jgi:hypothetical protein
MSTTREFLWVACERTCKRWGIHQRGLASWLSVGFLREAGLWRGYCVDSGYLLPHPQCRMFKLFFYVEFHLPIAHTVRGTYAPVTPATGG